MKREREVIAFMLILKRDSRAMASGATCGDAPRKMLTKIISEENEEALRIVVGVVVLLGGGSCSINPTIGDRRDRFASCFSHTHTHTQLFELSLPALPFLVLS